MFKTIYITFPGEAKFIDFKVREALFKNNQCLAQNGVSPPCEQNT